MLKKLIEGKSWKSNYEKMAKNANETIKPYIFWLNYLPLEVKPDYKWHFNQFDYFLNQFSQKLGCGEFRWLEFVPRYPKKFYNIEPSSEVSSSAQFLVEWLEAE